MQLKTSLKLATGAINPDLHMYYNILFISVNWTWNTNDITRQIVLSNENKDVRFHPGYSSGTAAIRGKFSCLPGHHYFWEIKMLTALYGTDVVSR